MLEYGPGYLDDINTEKRAHSLGRTAVGVFFLNAGSGTT